LTSTTVTDTDPLVDGYYWATTAPATVIAGDVYTVVTQTYGDNYSSGNAGTDNWATLTGTTYLYAPALGDPPSTSFYPYLDGVYYGGNVMIATPEGGESLMYLLLVGGSCCGALLLTCRSRA
jgi:hypothetical protein